MGLVCRGLSGFHRVDQQQSSGRRTCWDDHEVGITKEQAEGVISRSNLEYLDAANAKQAVEKYLSLFLEVEADGTVESLPDAAFYLTEE